MSGPEVPSIQDTLIAVERLLRSGDAEAVAVVVTRRDRLGGVHFIGLDADPPDGMDRLIGAVGVLQARLFTGVALALQAASPPEGDS